MNITRTCFLGLIFILFSSIVGNAQAPEKYEWKNVAIGGGGFVSAIITSKKEPGLLYARTDVGGAYRWQSANNTWVPLLDWVSADERGYMGIESIAIDPQLPNRLYILAGTSYFNGGKTAMMRSDDYGNTFSVVDVTPQFKAHGNGMGRQTGEKLVVDPNNTNIIYCGTRWNGLFKSTDAGQTWAKVNGLDVTTTTTNENGVSFVVLDASAKNATGTQNIYVGVSATGSNLYKSSDGGLTFVSVPGAPTNLMPQRAVLGSDGNLFITYANGAGPHGHWALPQPMDAGQIWKYNTATGTWVNITPANFNRAFGGISIDPGDPQRLVASSINTYMQQENNAYGDRVFLSTNGGTSWTDVFARGVDLEPDGVNWINGHAIHWAGSVEFDPFDTQKVWVTSGNGIFRTDNINAGTTVWKFVVKGLEETVPLDLVSIPNGPVVSVIGDYDGFRHTDVTQYAPIHLPQTGTTTGLAFAGQNTNVMLRVGDKMFYSLNMGQSWTECAKNGKKGLVAISANGETFLHCPEGSAVTYRSVNKGVSWAAVAGLAVSEARPVADYVNADKFYVYNRSTGSLLVSTNRGVSFSTAGSPGIGGSGIIRAVPGTEGHLWVPLNNGGLSRSINSGQSFSKVSNVSYCEAVGLGKAISGSTYPAIYIWGTVDNITGLHRSTDEGLSWVRINDDAHEYGGPGNGQFVVGDMNVYGRVYMSTVGRGIVYGQPEGTTVTGIKKVKALTFKYAPNPFSQNLQIQAPQPLTYKINNMIGAELESGKIKGAGLVGSGLPPGIYLLTLWHQHQFKTIKVIKSQTDL